MESIEFIKLKVKVSHHNSLQPVTNSAETNVNYIDFITLSDFKKAITYFITSQSY